MRLNMNRMRRSDKITRNNKKTGGVEAYAVGREVRRIFNLNECLYDLWQASVYRIYADFNQSSLFGLDNHLHMFAYNFYICVVYRVPVKI